MRMGPGALTLNPKGLKQGQREGEEELHTEPTLPSAWPRGS